MDQGELRESLVVGVEEAMDFIRKHLWQGQVIEAVHRRETLTIPPVGLREALIDALAHADYA